MLSKTRWTLALPVTLVLVSAATGQPTGKSSEPRKVTLDTGVTLHFVERGKGDPIVFVHGVTGDYRGAERWLADLPGDYRIIAYSRRYNYPNDNKPQKDHSAAVEAEDLAAFIKKLDLGKVHLVGHSYGGYTALICALRYPERVRTLMLAEPPVFDWLTDLPGDRAKEGKKEFEWWEEQRRLARAALRAGDKDKAYGYPPFSCPKEPGPRRTQVLENAREVEAAIMSEDIYPKVARAHVKKMKTPTLLMKGEKTKEHARGLWLVMDELERLVPEGNRRVAIIPGAGHMMWLQNTQACTQSLLAFLKGK
jgi:pimeloyl-ACP methyl ester carboxylesterase